MDWNSIIATIIVIIITAVLNWFVTTKTVNMRQAKLDKEKKVADIFYEKRAETLIEMFSNISVLYNNVMQLLLNIKKFSEYTIEADNIRNVEKIYQQLNDLEHTVATSVFLSRIYLSSLEYKNLYDRICTFVNNNSIYTGIIYDLNNLYYSAFDDYKEKEKISDNSRVSVDLSSYADFKNFLSKCKSIDISEYVVSVENVDTQYLKKADIDSVLLDYHYLEQLLEEIKTGVIKVLKSDIL